MATGIEILQTELSNGLGVILKEDHSAPIASFWTWYRVGSRNELPGKTGLSHWVEHMQFKGTPSLEKGQIFREVSSVGGTLNALTSHDWTAYFETLPVDQLELSLRIESDRMSNSLFTLDEVESERTVILSERQGAENNPGYALYEEVVGAAFHAHPYRHMVIGYESDLRQITRDDLYQHYRHNYHPGNAFVVAVGDFVAEELLHSIEEAFGSIPRGNDPAPVAVIEPPLESERRVTMRRPSGVPYLRMAFPSPDARHADLPALFVLDAILSGGKGMGLGGGGAMGRSSRLYRSLVASGLVRSVGSDIDVTIDPFLFQIGVTGLPGSDLAHIEAVIEEQLRQVRVAPPAPAELERAMHQVEAQFVYSAEGVTNQAFWLGQWEIVDSRRRAGSLPDEIRGVTAGDVMRVANTYLLPDRRTIGWLLPGRDGGEVPSGAAPPALVPRAWGLTGPRQSGEPPRFGFQRAELDNGVVVLGQERPESRSVAMRIRLAAGSMYEPDELAGIAFLTSRSLLRGAAGLTYEAINELTDSLGSSVTVDAGKEFVEARFRLLGNDLPAMTALAGQILLTPDFPAEEIERIRIEQLGAIAESDNDTRATADRVMRRAVYPLPNPLGRRTLGSAETISSITRNDVVNYHAAQFRPRSTAIAVVGGIGSFAATVDTISRALGAWGEPSQIRPRPTLGLTNGSSLQVEATIAGKTQADIAAGVPTIARGHEEFYALDVANLILGRLGLMGRLGAEVRDRRGLAYYAFSQIEPRKDGSLWVMRAGVDPANVDNAIEAVIAELGRIRAERVSEEELRNAKNYLVGVLPLALETHDGVAATLLAIEEFGLGLDYLGRYPDIIAGVTQEDVLDAAHQHLDPQVLAIGIAGPTKS